MQATCDDFPVSVTLYMSPSFFFLRISVGQVQSTVYLSNNRRQRTRCRNTIHITPPTAHKVSLNSHVFKQGLRID
jgi:hypothetical protein